MSAPLTEDQIERMAERRMDRLDAWLMSGRLDQDEYDHAVRDLDREISELHAASARLRTFYADNLAH